MISIAMLLFLGSILLVFETFMLILDEFNIVRTRGSIVLRVLVYSIAIEQFMRRLLV